MTVLQVPPDAPAWASIGADLLLLGHITGGSVAIVSGAVALLARKGEPLHRAAGTVFFLAMLLAAGIGAVVSPFLTDGQRANTLAGTLTFYLVLTAWAAVQRADGGGRSALVIGGFLVALVGALVATLFMFQAQASPTGTLDDAPPQAFYVFMLIGWISAATDLKVIMVGGITGAPRIARHLWRMCVALLVASGSFFLGQQQVMPVFMRGSPWLFVPTFAPLAFLIFWMIRVRLTNWYRNAPDAFGQQAS